MSRKNEILLNSALLVLLVTLLVLFLNPSSLVVKMPFLTKNSLSLNESFSDIHSIMIDVVSEDVLIKQHESDVVEVRYEGFHQPNLSVKNNTLTIEAKHVVFSLFKQSGKVVILVPKTIFDEINCTTVSSKMEIDVVAHTIITDTISGKTVIERNATSNKINSISGKVEISLVEKGNVDCETVSGNVIITIDDTLNSSTTFSSVSGKLKTSNKNESTIPDCIIQVETVSGNCSIE